MTEPTCEPTPPSPEPAEKARAQLQAIVPLLRETRHIDPEVQEALADLVDELIRVIDPHAPAAETAHLAQSSTHLIQALHRKHHQGLINAAKERLEEAATRSLAALIR